MNTTLVNTVPNFEVETNMRIHLYSPDAASAHVGFKMVFSPVRLIANVKRIASKKSLSVAARWVASTTIDLMMASVRSSLSNGSEFFSSITHALVVVFTCSVRTSENE